MKAHSAGLVVYRLRASGPEVLVAHMGGPFHSKKDIGAWSIPKGLVENDEEPLGTAKREFAEELGLTAPEGEYLELGTIQQHNNKEVTAFAIEADIDVSNIKSNTFTLEWPPKSGKTQEFPEIDRAAWLSLSDAAQKTVKGQAELFERLVNKLNVPFNSQATPGPPQQKSLF